MKRKKLAGVDSFDCIASAAAGGHAVAAGAASGCAAGSDAPLVVDSLGELAPLGAYEDVGAEPPLWLSDSRDCLLPAAHPRASAPLIVAPYIDSPWERVHAAHLTRGPFAAAAADSFAHRVPEAGSLVDSFVLRGTYVLGGGTAESRDAVGVTLANTAAAP